MRGALRSKWHFIWKGKASTARRVRPSELNLTVTDGKVDIPASQDSLGLQELQAQGPRYSRSVNQGPDLGSGGP